MSPPEGLDAELHRYLDGEPTPGLEAGRRAEAERFREAIDAYTSGLDVPGAEVDLAVMAAVRAKAMRTRVPSRLDRLWEWLFQPRTVRVRPALVAFASFALIVIGAVTVGRLGRAGAGTDGLGSETILVRFELSAPDARSVTLAGSFNDWSAEGVELVKNGMTGVWTGTVPLEPGEHEYLFVVDGVEWIPDPSAHAQVDDGFGQSNSVIVVGPRGVIRS